ncbi:Unknown protein, partial [Striga hermonthica]
LQQAYVEEALYWKSKARIKWLQAGDRNTKFFQACVKQRRGINAVDNLLNNRGVKCKSKSETVEVISDYFQKMFQSENPVFVEDVLSGIHVSITAAMNLKLTRTVDEQEIKAAL